MASSQASEPRTGLAGIADLEASVLGGELKLGGFGFNSLELFGFENEAAPLVANESLAGRNPEDPVIQQYANGLTAPAVPTFSTKHPRFPTRKRPESAL
jgi:hypothetical protein